MRAQNRARAFTLAEVLLAITLVALLLLSVGVALQASFDSYQENDRIAAATQTARSALGRMSREIRNADAISASTSAVTILPPSGGDWPDQIEYELSGGTLYYRRTVGGTQSEYVLLGSDERVSVSAFEVGSQTGEDAEGTPCTKTVTIRLVLNVDGQTYPVSTSVSPRRNQTF
jgi:type II secretory pathway pseudopilin PulG